MKAPALLSLATALALASCFGPSPRPPGPRGYSLDTPPGDVRYGQEQPGVPTDTRYLDTTGTDPIATPPPTNPNDPAAATVQPPNPAAPDGAAPAQPGATPNPAPTPAPTPTPAPSPNSYPTATRTKAGFVKSPFDPLGREIDVREMRSGQKARCPYTQKIFLVP